MSGRSILWRWCFNRTSKSFFESTKAENRVYLEDDSHYHSIDISGHDVPPGVKFVKLFHEQRSNKEASSE